MKDWAHTATVVAAILGGLMFFSGQIDNRVGSLEANLNARFDSLETNFNARFDGVDLRLDAMDANLRGLNSRIGRLEGFREAEERIR